MIARRAPRDVDPERPRPTIKIELVAGQSQQREALLQPGRAIPLLVIGARAPWRVAGAGLAPIHLAFAFNGASLFVGSPGKKALYVNGSDVSGLGWVEVPGGAIVEAGRARFIVRHVRAAPLPRRGPWRAAAREARHSTSAVTLIADVTATRSDAPLSSDPVTLRRTATFPSEPHLRATIQPLSRDPVTPPSERLRSRAQHASVSTDARASLGAGVAPRAHDGPASPEVHGSPRRR